jgi:hypothetical protein
MFMFISGLFAMATQFPSNPLWARVTCGIFALGCVIGHLFVIQARESRYAHELRALQDEIAMLKAGK